jgi:hypothetical protein
LPIRSETAPHRPPSPSEGAATRAPARVAYGETFVGPAQPVRRIKSLD